MDPTWAPYRLGELQPFVNQVVDLGCSFEEYAGLASVAYVNAHIEEFNPEEVKDRVDFISMILQEYDNRYSPTKVSELIEVLKTHNFI